MAGGSRGLGRSVALALGEEGMRIAIAARELKALQSAASDVERLGVECLPIRGDVTKSEDIRSMVTGTVERFGGIDVLVVNAGGPPSLSFVETNEDAWWSAFELTLMSAVRLIRESLPHLIAAKGNVVTIGSISVKQPIPGLALSNSIRPAVVGLTKTLSEEMAAAGVRFNNILPGMILTDRSRELAEARAKTSRVSSDEIIAETERSIPLRRYGKLEEVANLAVFLASGAASYITGASVLGDGGLFKGSY